MKQIKLPIKNIEITKEGKIWRYYYNTKSWKERKYHINENKRSHRKSLQISIKGKVYNVSRLVALAYIPNPHNYPYVCHKDNNPLNNHYKNLYWGTQQMNMQQAANEGRMPQLWTSVKNPGLEKSGELSPTSKLSNVERAMIWYLYCYNILDTKEISSIFRISLRTVYNTINKYKYQY